jgi:hypothetical protein
LPNLVYYALVVITTKLILVSGAAILLLPTGVLSRSPLGIIGFLLVYKIIIAIAAVAFVAHKKRQEHSVILGAAGLVLGRFVGLLLGGFLGFTYGGTIGGVVGIIAFSFLVGRLGSKISLMIGKWLDQFTSPATDPATAIEVVWARPNAWFVIIYAVIVPALLVVLSVFFKSSGISTSQYPADLPTARIVIVALSLVSACMPWLLRARLRAKAPSNPRALESSIFIVGMGLSMAPAIYGFFLFLGFGASVPEMVVFAGASSAATAIWSADTKRRETS